MASDPRFNPYAAPEQPAPPPPPPPGLRQRGGCLTALLVLMMISNGLTSVFYLVVPREKLMAAVHAPAWVSPVLGVLTLANLAFAVAVWKFKKWGVYGLLGTGAVAFAVNVGILSMRVGGVIGLLGPLTLLALVRPLWREFE